MRDVTRKIVIRFSCWLAASVIVVLLGIFAIAFFYGEKDEDKYSIRLTIENRTDHRVFAVIFPIITSENTVMDKFSTSYDCRVFSPAMAPEPREATFVAVKKIPANILGRIDTEQIRLEAHCVCDVFYYLGKNVHFNDLRIVMVAWFADDGWNSDLIQTPPQGVYTLYNPQYVTGPETYDWFGTLIIE